MELDFFYCLVVKILRKLIAIFDWNCYHGFVVTRGIALCVLYETGLAGELGILSLSLCYKADDNTKSSNIKESDGGNVDFSDGGASFILPGTYAIWGKIICGITP